MAGIKHEKPAAVEDNSKRSTKNYPIEESDEEPELPDTVFIRNLATFDTTQESLKEYIEKNFGETVYCLICKDKETGMSKGTAFVKFKSPETAQQCLDEFEDPQLQTKFFLDGRNIFVLPALTRDKISEVKRAKAPSIEADNLPKKKKKPRHNRPQAKISSDTGSSNRPSSVGKKQLKQNHHHIANNRERMSSKMDKKKGKRQSTKPLKLGQLKPAVGKKVKKNSAKKKKATPKKMSRGRH